MTLVQRYKKYAFGGKNDENNPWNGVVGAIPEITGTAASIVGNGDENGFRTRGGIIGKSALTGASIGSKLGSNFGPMGTLIGTAAGTGIGAFTGLVTGKSKQEKWRLGQRGMNTDRMNEDNNRSGAMIAGDPSLVLGNRYKEMYGKGGKLKPKEPIITNDKKKVQAYQDSLTLNNAYLFQKANTNYNYKDNIITPISIDKFKKEGRDLTVGKIQPLKTKVNYYKESITDRFDTDSEGDKAFPGANIKKLTDYYRTLQKANPRLRYSNGLSPDPAIKGIEPVAEYFDGNMFNPVYKEPEQPYIYQKPDVMKKVDSRTVGQHDYSYTLVDPTFSQPTLETKKYQMQGQPVHYGSSMIGKLDGSDFYPDYYNEAARAKVNQPETDLMNNEQGLTDYLKLKGVNNPNIKKFNAGGPLTTGQDPTLDPLPSMAATISAYGTPSYDENVQVFSRNYGPEAATELQLLNKRLGQRGSADLNTSLQNISKEQLAKTGGNPLLRKFYSTVAENPTFVDQFQYGKAPETETATLVKKASGGKINSPLANTYMTGGTATALSNGATEIEGNSHDNGGVKVPSINAELEGGETTSGDFVFSKELGFAKLHKPVAKAMGKIEKKPATRERVAAMKLLKGRENKLALSQEYLKKQLGIA